jgi:hypothetical protein
MVRSAFAVVVVLALAGCQQQEQQPKQKDLAVLAAARQKHPDKAKQIDDTVERLKKQLNHPETMEILEVKITPPPSQEDAKHIDFGVLLDFRAKNSIGGVTRSSFGAHFFKTGYVNESHPGEIGNDPQGVFRR